MSGSPAGVVIVGAGLGGIRVAESLRSNAYSGPITMIGAEAHPPYDRPPLSKSVLQGKDDRVDLKPAEFFAESSIELRAGERVSAVSPDEHTITIEKIDDPAHSETLRYDTLVLATGLHPRPLPGAEAVAGVHVLRTIDDALTLRGEIEGATRAVVVGAGFIGCEVAASLNQRGLEVTLVEPAPAPLAAALGTEIGALVARLHTARGVKVLTGVGVDGLVTDDARVTAVRLADGTVVDADIVVVGIGSTPVVDYLDGSGIEMAPRETGGGIACDEHGATSAPDVYALGDVANWRTETGGTRRVEHWTHTVEQSTEVAHRIAQTDAMIPAAPPYFWSDQYELKIQVLGRPEAGDDVHIVDDDGTKFLAYYSRDGFLTAVVGAGKVGPVMKTRPKLLTRTPISEVLG
ncbi:NAD(P)/FAD-dependent oxidoreductase [Gordonia rhizosphera]|uniref:Putative ferredoxin reductase n=1 Tax=Gordonia rhizosphera NBRC 16068 TaxID=1108045 RepID=K6W8C0_9ACTN|nr:FAD-dependent oxidoreductase [Gordonia rhizosphera]GAB89996.1 putative ferredoxin reductase [Gordonia rhizosphera NBRC 16068]